MSLPDNVYLASNVGYAPGRPAFGENVASGAEREAQWKRILEARGNGRLYDVFKTEQDYRQFYLESPRRNKPGGSG